MKHLACNITDIQRFSVHDGPGIRTVVFFKGCPLRCKWCQNPETQKMENRILFNQALCIGCRKCIDVCPYGAIDPLTGYYDRTRCVACGRCVENCYSGARTIPGKQLTLEEVFRTICDDLIFYQKSSGGVTLSGGEVTMHPDFAVELLNACQERGIHTAIETCGYCTEEVMRRFLHGVDMFLYDIKHTDSERHRLYTGVGNERILSNLFLLAENRKNIVIRMPFIPGVNDEDENLVEMGKIALRVRAMEVHLLPFHQLGEGKWDNLDIYYECRNFQSPTEEQLQYAKDILERMGLCVNIGGLGIYDGKGEKSNDQSRED